jgi:hypothetical protein
LYWDQVWLFSPIQSADDEPFLSLGS